MSAPPDRLHSIAPTDPFLPTLARGLVDRLGDAGPEALADATILLPTRRAGRGLAAALRAELGVEALLLPRVRALGDVDPDEAGLADLEDPDLPPAVDPLRRRLELARLVRAWDAKLGRPQNPAGALGAADALAALLDQAGLLAQAPDWSVLDGLAAERELAAHWAISADFLTIIGAMWPARLAELGCIDPGARRRLALEALAARWATRPPTGLVIVAGSTGSVPATRALMETVANLPAGHVVFPGLDANLAGEVWDAAAEDAQHPQHAMAVTLRALGVEPGMVGRWSRDGADAGSGRMRLINEALRPASHADDWRGRAAACFAGPDGRTEPAAAAAVAGLSLADCRTSEEEAEVVALALREALEEPGRTCALVTPDQGLARRVAAKMARWGVTLDVSAGRPLAETPPGTLARLALGLALDPGDPVLIAAVLKHPLVRLGLERPALRRAAADLEVLGLRRPRSWDDLAGLKARLETPLDASEVTAPRPVLALVAALDHALAPLSACPDDAETGSGALFLKLASVLDALCAPDSPWGGDAGEALSGLLRSLIAHGDVFGPIPPDARGAVFDQLIAGMVVRPRGSHPRAAILGPLEARLQSVDLIVLGGLNEGAWPAPAPADPFLSRPMRAALGLPSPETRIGLAAHDFAQAACSRHVLLTRAARADDKPAVRSRWLWRLEALAEAAFGEGGAARLVGEGDRLISLARALEPPRGLAPAGLIPAPKPPAQDQPTRFSATELDRLIRDPYSVYANRLLGLKPLGRLGEPPGARELGIAVHAAAHQLAQRYAAGERPNDPAGLLLEIYGEEMRRLGFTPDACADQQARLQEFALQVADMEQRERATGPVFTEADGAFELKGLDVPIEIRGRADRITVEGEEAVILDYKTGSRIPTNAQIAQGLSVQLGAMTLMLEGGGFAGVPASRVREVVYMKARRKPDRIAPLETKDAALRQPDLVDHTRDVLLDWIGALRLKGQGWGSGLRREKASDASDYDHLARRDEWANVGEEDDAGGEDA